MLSMIHSSYFEDKEFWSTVDQRFRECLFKASQPFTSVILLEAVKIGTDHICDEYDFSRLEAINIQ